MCVCTRASHVHMSHMCKDVYSRSLLQVSLIGLFYTKKYIYTYMRVCTRASHMHMQHMCKDVYTCSCKGLSYRSLLHK